MRKNFMCFLILILMVGFLYADEALNKKLVYAAQNGNLEFVEKLITHGADTELKNSEEKTSLSMVEKSGYKKIVSPPLAIGKYEFKDLSARDKRLNLMLIGDSVKIETEL